MKTTQKNQINLKTLFLSLLAISMFFSSCKKDDGSPGLETKVLDCSSEPAQGETLTLDNRNDGVDYIINCNYLVNGDLIINPDVTIQFGTDAGIEVYGSLQAIGSSEQPIIFTGEDKVAGSWKGIYFESNDIKNELSYNQIEYAGGGAFNSNGDKAGVIVYAGTKLKLRNTTIRNSETYGINASYGGCDLSIENNTITSCDAPVFVRPQYADRITGGNYTGNTTDAIIVDSYTSSITHEAIWTDLGVPYRITDYLQVNPGGKLTINPGVVMEFGIDAYIYINEGASGPKPSIVAVGTVDNPILFTGINKVLGAWQGIYFDSPSPLNEIGFATIEYASTAGQTGAIETWYDTVLNVHDVTFNHIQYCAFHQYIFSTATNTLTTSNITYNDVGGTICQDN